MKINIVGLELLEKDLRVKTKNIIKKVLQSSNLNKIITISLIDSEQMIELQKMFKNKNSVTDVLSFPLPEMEQKFEHTKNILGDIVICVEQTQKQALELGHEFIEELGVLVAHGLFHLLGLDHERSHEEADLQMQAEMQLLEKAGLNPLLSLIGRQK